MTETKEKKTSKGAFKRGAGVGHVYKTLHREIIELKIAPGSPIDELQLAARFSMSRTPIREALVRLAAEGLITTLAKPRHDCFQYRFSQSLPILRCSYPDVQGDDQTGRSQL